MASEEQHYGMGGDVAASARLSLQHFLITKMFGWALHPTASAGWRVENPPTLKRVADVACGNGIWVYEIATSNLADNLEVVGFDIRDTFFPAKHEWPANVKFELWDMYEPPPKQYEGQFDIVNIRLVSPAVRKGDPRPVLDNVLKLLKPGGFVQWCEFEFISSVLPEDSAYRKIFEAIITTGAFSSLEWIPKLDRIFREDGKMEQVQTVTALPKKEIRHFWCDSWLLAMGEMVRGVGTPEMNGIWAECEKEREKYGLRGNWPSIIVVGRKSLGGSGSE